MVFFSITSRLRSSKLGMTKSNNDLSHSASNCEITLHFKDLVVFCTPAPQRKSFSVNTVYLGFYINEKYCLLRKSVYFSVLSTEETHLCMETCRSSSSEFNVLAIKMEKRVEKFFSCSFCTPALLYYFSVLCDSEFESAIHHV